MFPSDDYKRSVNLRLKTDKDYSDIEQYTLDFDATVESLVTQLRQVADGNIHKIVLTQPLIHMTEVKVVSIEDMNKQVTEAALASHARDQIVWPVAPVVSIETKEVPQQSTTLDNKPSTHAVDALFAAPEAQLETPSTPTADKKQPDLVEAEGKKSGCCTIF